MSIFRLLRMYSNHQINCISLLNCLLFLLVIINAAIKPSHSFSREPTSGEIHHKSQNLFNVFDIGQLVSKTPILVEDELVRVDNGDSLERRSGGGYGTTLTNGGRTQLAISLERVKNPDDYPDPYKKKKFPITWLRNQYPFNTYYKKKKNKDKPSAAKYAGEPMMGQYSSDSYEVLDPNPSTWVKIPDRPTASIKFHKQQDSNYEQSFIRPPLSAISSLHPSPFQAGVFNPSASGSAPLLHLPLGANPFSPNPHLLMQNGAPFTRDHLVNGAPMAQAQSGLMMTSESQNNYRSPAASVAAGSEGAAPEGGQQEGQQGFGGISLSFGNGRSISFGGGQGLTIGGRAGAISIGGKGGNDNQPAASGYSETKGGYSAPQSAAGYASGSGGSGSGSGSGGYGYGDNGYVSKHPTMSVESPRKGKTLIHANLDMPPVKARLHSSPRIKVITGSRDPLEKPGDEELTAEEEDIFEEPEPFIKANATQSANNETLSTSTNATTTTSMLNGTLDMTTTLSPMQLQQDGRYPQEYDQQYTQQGFGPYNQKQQQQQQLLLQPGREQFDSGLARPHQTNQPYHNNNHRPQQHPVYPPYPAHPIRQQAFNQAQQYSVQVPFDEPPQFVGPASLQQPQRQLATNQAGHYKQFDAINVQPSPPQMQQVPQPARQPDLTESMRPANVERQPEQVTPFNDAPSQMLPPMQQPPGAPPTDRPADMALVDDQRPAVNQWRQYSPQARQQMNRFVPKQQDLTIDNNPRFYNGGHPNSIVEPQLPSRQPNNFEQREARDTVEDAASSQIGSYTPNGAGIGKPTRSAMVPLVVGPQHTQFNPSTVYQVAGRPDMAPIVGQSAISAPQHEPAIESVSSRPMHNSAKQSPIKQQQPPVPVARAKQENRAGQVQAQESGYHQALARPGGQRSSYGEAPSRTYTLGRGGISSYYGSGGGDDHSSGSGSSSSDGFDQKHYQAKVEKFDPEAHDKREKSKVILFLKPRISIHSANSSTTTKRPKNAQRFINVINRPIFLNSTDNRTHHDEDFLDPDLAEPFEIYNYGHGYGGNGYGGAYNRAYYNRTSSSTTKKPKPKKKTTTTSTTTTTVTPESESTTVTPSTTASGETESTSTTSSSSSSEEPSSSSSTSTTEADSSSTTTTEGAGGSSTTENTDSGGDGSASSSPSSAETPTSSTEGTSTMDDSSSSSSSTSEPSTSSIDSLPAKTTPEVSVVSMIETENQPDQDSSSEAALPEGSTMEPASTSSMATDSAEIEDSENNGSSSSSSSPSFTDDSAADLIMSATESVPTTTLAAATTTTTTTTTTQAPSTSASTRKAPIKPRVVRTSTSTTTSTTSTTTSTTSTSTTTTPAPSSTEAATTLAAMTSTLQEMDSLAETTSKESVESQPSSTPAIASSSSLAPQPDEPANDKPEKASMSNSMTASEDSEFVSEPQSPAKRSVRVASMTEQAINKQKLIRAQSKQEQQQPQPHSQQPMLLNAQLIDKLMSNKTLVGLMSNQLKRVIDTEQMSDLEKQRIVRQVFDQMMEQKVDFSMQNVRLAVKTVSSSYRAAAEKQRKRSASSLEPVKGKQVEVLSGSRQSAASKIDLKGFGRRASPTEQSKGRTDEKSTTTTSTTSKSFPVIDTALKLTKRSSARADKSKAGIGQSTSLLVSDSRSGEQQKMDASGNPIVVVLLPQEKA